MQDEIFPDEDDFGRIFRNNAVISAMGIPQYAAVMGNCVAGGAYLPVLSDTLLMTEGSQLYLAGPALVKAAIGQTADPEELGGARMHAEISGTADYREPDDHACLRAAAVADRLAAAVPTGSGTTDGRLRLRSAIPRICTRSSRPTAAREYDVAGPAGVPGGCRLAAGIPGRVWPHRGDGLRPHRRPAGRRGGQPAAAMPHRQRAKCRSAA